MYMLPPPPILLVSMVFVICGVFCLFCALGKASEKGALLASISLSI